MEGTEQGHLTKTGPYGCPIPYGIVLSNKTWSKEGWRKDVWSDSVCLANKPLSVMSPAILEMAECLSTDGKQWRNSLLWFVCVHRFYLGNYVLSKSMNSHTFTFLILSLITLEESESGWVVLALLLNNYASLVVQLLIVYSHTDCWSCEGKFTEA